MTNDLSSTERPTYLFMDTKWADSSERKLVSIALISEDGQHSLYAERDPVPADVTECARALAYPRLDGGAAAMNDR
ncbi:MAG: hypothetical protein ABIR16_03180 [Dokdonella sp.]